MKTEELEKVFDWAECGIFNNHMHNKERLQHNLEILERVKTSIYSFQPPVEEGEKQEQVLLPRRLTAENGAKALLIGEFFETVDLEEGSFELPVSWITIKNIYEKIVDHYSKSVKEVSKEGEKETQEELWLQEDLFTDVLLVAEANPPADAVAILMKRYTITRKP